MKLKPKLIPEARDHYKFEDFSNTIYVRCLLQDNSNNITGDYSIACKYSEDRVSPCDGMSCKECIFGHIKTKSEYDEALAYWNSQFSIENLIEEDFLLL